MSKISIIFDIDNTLITFYNSKVILRPYINELLCFCFENFKNIGIWTAAHPIWLEYITEYYLKPLIHIFSPYKKLFVEYSRENCIMLNGTYHKPLSKITENFDIDCKDLIIVDDVRENFLLNPSNGIEIPGFYIPDLHDNKLRSLVFFLREILDHYKETDDVRVIDKEQWWNKY